MKRAFFLCALVVLLSIKFSAASDGTTNDYRIAVWAGLSNTGLSPENSLPVFTFGPYNHNKNGLLAGGTIEIPLSEKYSIESGLFYNQAGGTTSRMVGTNEQGEILGKYWFVQDLRYLEIPLLAKADFRTGFLNTFVLAGPNLGFLLSANEKFESDYDAPEFARWDDDIKGDISKYNFGADIGLGVSYPFSEKLHFSIVAKYSFGLINLLSSDEMNGTQRSRDLKIMTGISAGL